MVVAAVNFTYSLFQSTFPPTCSVQCGSTMVAGYIWDAEGPYTGTIDPTAATEADCVSHCQVSEALESSPPHGKLLRRHVG